MSRSEFCAVRVRPLAGEMRHDALRRLDGWGCPPSSAAEMPCGKMVAARRRWTEVPTVDVPCPCGNAKHWLVRWEAP